MDQHNAVSSPLTQPNISNDPVSQRGLPATISIDRIDYRIARCRDDYTGAFNLLQRRYRDAGLSTRPDQLLRVMPYHLWPKTQVFVAVHRNAVIGTVSLVSGNELQGVPMELTYPQTISRLKRQRIQFAEVCSLCVESRSGESTGNLFGELTRLMIFHARSVGLDALVAVVHPRHAKFYQRAMGFNTIGEVRSYDQAAGQPGIPILGQVNDQSAYRPRWRKYYFEGNFTPSELIPHEMMQRDQIFFQQFFATPRRESHQYRAA